MTQAQAVITDEGEAIEVVADGKTYEYDYEDSSERASQIVNAKAMLAKHYPNHVVIDNT